MRSVSLVVAVTVSASTSRVAKSSGLVAPRATDSSDEVPPWNMSAAKASRVRWVASKVAAFFAAASTARASFALATASLVDTSA